MSGPPALTARDVAAQLRPLVRGAPFLFRLKATYRAYICPLPDVLAYVPPGSTVLDIGCGGGVLLSLVAAYRSPRALAGVEVDRAALRLARQVLARQAQGVPLSLELHEGADVPSAVGGADVVTMVDVLHHIPAAAQDRYLAQLVERLRPGARFILKDIDASRPILTAANKLHDLVLAGEMGRERRFGEVLEILRRAGLSIVAATTQRQFVYPHYTIVADKPAAEG